MNLSKEHAETLDASFNKMKVHLPGLRMIISNEGIDVYDGKKHVHQFEGDQSGVYALMSFFLGISIAFRSDPTLKTVLKNL